QWFKRTFSDYSWELADQFILPDRRIMSKKEVIAQMNNIFASCGEFKNEEYFIKEIKFDLNENGGIGHAEGGVRYDAVLENGETILIQGPFKLYLSFEGGWWSIFHIVFPGFKY
ncbi:MAG: hypothetical protein ABIN13_09420, partial [Mucilaginibacter sp.]